jgi:alanine racemase
MTSSDLYSTWIEVDLERIAENVRSLRKISNAQVMAVVKANGYGHGAIPVVQAALAGGATWCGVARPEEAMEIRQAGLDCPILLLGYTPPAQVEGMITLQVSMAVWEPEQIQAAALAAQRTQQAAHLHLKVDTGMSRLGVQAEQAVSLALQLAQADHVYFEGIFTHFASADETDPEPTDSQERQMQSVLQALQAQGIKPPLMHAANSAASLTRPTTHFDMLRVGIAMYGLPPSPDCPLPDHYRPALAWKSVLSHVKVLPPGRGVSYGHEYITQGTERIGTVPVGYADGYRRVKGNRVLVRGRKAPVIGRVCMDQILVQLDGIPEAHEGDEVVLIGQQGDAKISAEEVGALWGTVNYEVICGIGPRVPRVYSPLIGSSPAGSPPQPW